MGWPDIYIGSFVAGLLAEDGFLNQVAAFVGFSGSGDVIAAVVIALVMIPLVAERGSRLSKRRYPQSRSSVVSEHNRRLPD